MLAAAPRAPRGAARVLTTLIEVGHVVIVAKLVLHVVVDVLWVQAGGGGVSGGSRTSMTCSTAPEPSPPHLHGLQSLSLRLGHVGQRCGVCW